MKHLLAVLMAMFMMVTLAACGGTADGGAEKQGGASQSHTHAYEGTVTKKANCVSDGIKTYTCACGDTYTEAIASTGEHDYVGTETAKATCVNAGLKSYTCSGCKDAYTEPIPATGRHNYELTETTQETCAKDGVQTFTCSMCKDAYTQTIPATGKHNYEGQVTTKATCTSDGVKTFTCSGCESSYTETIPGGHKWIEASCTAAKNCSVCFAVDGNALGHTTDNGTCGRCGIVISKPIVYSGKGDQVITGVNIPTGSFKATITHDGDRHSAVKLYYGDGQYDYQLLSNETDPYVVEEYLSDHLDSHKTRALSNGMLNVTGDGNWTITIERITETSTRNVAGKGTIVTGVFQVTGGRNVVSITHDGKRHFDVKIYKENGGQYDYELLVNETGAYSGQTLVTLESNTNYFFAVSADGNWTVNLGYGDEVTYYSNPVPSAGGSSSGSSSGGSSSGGSSSSSSDATLWSYSEAKSLSDNANKATDTMNECVGYINDGFKGGLMKATYYSMAVAKMKTVVSYLESMQRLAKENRELKITSGEYSTVLAKIEGALGMARAFAARDISSDNLPDYTEFSGAAMDVYTECLGLYNLSVQLLKEFS